LLSKERDEHGTEIGKHNITDDVRNRLGVLQALLLAHAGPLLSTCPDMVYVKNVAVLDGA
jgi:hypothetical protein